MNRKEEVEPLLLDDRPVTVACLLCLIFLAAGAYWGWL